MRLVSIVALTFFVAFSIHAVECVCVKESHRSKEKIEADRRETYQKATAVFAGKVVAVDAYSVRFKLVKRWKGDKTDEVILSTGAVPGHDGTPLPEECSYQFHLGEEYLVYAFGPVGKMKASICFTFLSERAVEEEKGLDLIKPHESIREASN